MAVHERGHRLIMVLEIAWVRQNGESSFINSVISNLVVATARHAFSPLEVSFSTGHRPFLEYRGTSPMKKRSPP